MTGFEQCVTALVSVAREGITPEVAIQRAKALADDHFIHSGIERGKLLRAFLDRVEDTPLVEPIRKVIEGLA